MQDARTTFPPRRPVPNWFVAALAVVLGLLIGWWGNHYAWPAQAAWLGAVDRVETVEVNTFGDHPRTVLIYRDADNSIVDWRWYWCAEQIPASLGGGRHVAVWNDQGKPRTVYCNSVRYTRTLADRELAERDQLPDDRRRKLSR